ncbi:hypothetical protein SYYSPA8_33750 [Streptomyces yaizuensis]|uniref:Uncharacterized protein n=1 Tax=Streptomyces yaizuensis TaxID=2989713 RepID=A0ABQ5P9W0_9ACTN|nr:hypothetical protein SYYSPA8_33750 [Streptomyces sp. YSPA8]
MSKTSPVRAMWSTPGLSGAHPCGGVSHLYG